MSCSCDNCGCGSGCNCGGCKKFADVEQSFSESNTTDIIFGVEPGKIYLSYSKRQTRKPV